ncbi:CDP-alcohol phosphatidyltransferase family protein [Methylomonas methanica]|uniref:CDP-alcohol phosphatidyltransferase n=1 Tax=Methylomonas methanica (strain DSM 25384 / MC09) TaxID=857087 RepID=F9ZWE2_METMM|nr:CDP-alcohol phosphatidyltransferase family protein [Methylomonas methanica]AEF99611.1 hypothetical protein Metme_1183 [Methylomonas methanica MC09]
MIKIISHIFADKYVNHNAVIGNPILLLMYRLAYPFAVLLVKLRFSPNQITTQSLIFSMLAFSSLVFDEGCVWFSVFWGMTVLLDFCDGTVARMTDTVSKTAFRYDHMSDIFKISLVVLGVGIRFDEMPIWILCSSFIFFYGYSEILAHDLKNFSTIALLNDLLNSSEINSAVKSDQNIVERQRIRDRFEMLKFALERFPLLMNSMLKIFKFIYSAIFTFNGHTLLIFFLLPVGGWVTKIVFIHLIYLSFHGSVSGIRQLRHINR